MRRTIAAGLAVLCSALFASVAFASEIAPEPPGFVLVPAVELSDGLVEVGLFEGAGLVVMIEPQAPMDTLRSADQAKDHKTAFHLVSMPSTELAVHPKNGAAYHLRI